MAAEPGARFCNSCGTPMAGGDAIPSGGGRTGSPRPGAQAAATGTVGTESKAPWIIAGAMFIALMGVVVYPLVRQDEVALQMPTQSQPLSGGAGAVDLSSMTPREAADRLYDRVMQLAEEGDSTQVAFFVPMALQAYVNAEPLDNDGIFHLSMLQQTADDLPAAIETAERGLANNENHILLLYALAEAQVEAEDLAAAKATYQKMFDVWDAQIASGLADYDWHRNMLESIQERGREVLAR